MTSAQQALAVVRRLEPYCRELYQASLYYRAFGGEVWDDFQAEWEKARKRLHRAYQRLQQPSVREWAASRLRPLHVESYLETVF